jgi:hypothetical protein
MAFFQNNKFGPWLLPALLCAQILSVLGSSVRAQEGQISIQASVDKDSITIGDVITYDLMMTHSPEMFVEPPQLGANLGPFEIRDRRQLPQQKLEGGRLESRFRYVISIFETGQQMIPSVEMSYIDSAGQSGTVASQEIAIAVESIKPNQAGDIRDLKPPVSLPGTHALLYRLSGLLLFLAAGTAAFLYLRKKRARPSLETIEYQGPPRPAHEIALEELDRIAALKLIQRGLIKQFYTEISEAIKRYISRRYRMKTMELTTTELMAAMERASVPGKHIGAYQPFFQEGDLVKFAKHIPSREHMDGALDQARQLVHLTREELLPTPPEAVASPLVEATPAESGSGEQGGR